ncbi:hypothetical protein ACR9E3_22850 [Actinomycetospora sp. C-140]
MGQPVMLKDLLRSRHWQSYSSFNREYDRAAKTIDDKLVGSGPSRAQLHRWQAGDLKGMPYPHHCQVLEVMFPGVPAAAMFEPAAQGDEDGEAVRLSEVVERSLDASSETTGWSAPVPTQRPTPNVGFPRPVSDHKDPEGSPTSLARSLRLLGRRLRLSDDEVSQLAQLAGMPVDLELECTVDIDAEGWSTITYRFELLNLTANPIKRMHREQWFETTDGPLRIEPDPSADRKMSIQRIHDTANMSKFALVCSPAIEPGEIGTLAYSVRGGRFTHDHFWRQASPRHSRHFTLNIRHHGVDMLVGCSAVEDKVDGSQVSAIDDLVCDDEDGSAFMTVTRDYLQPGEAVTVRWEVARGDA